MLCHSPDFILSHIVSCDIIIIKQRISKYNKRDGEKRLHMHIILLQCIILIAAILLVTIVNLSISNFKLNFIIGLYT
jgi:hypothetical protein